MNAAITKAAAAWKPVHRGLIYCSPGCGAGCTRAAYNKAVDEAEALAKKMGKGWRPEVWENLGWHWAIVKGTEQVYVKIYAGRPNKGYWVDSRLPQQVCVDVKDLRGLRNGVKLVLDIARTQANATLAAVESLS